MRAFITAHRAEIVARCRARVATRVAPLPTEQELDHGVPMFLDQLVATLPFALTSSQPAIAEAAAKHASALIARGFTIAQVVHDYGGICEVITELAALRSAPITPREFQTFNMCLDEAIAAAVTEYARVRERQRHEQMGHLAHELRNFLDSAVLALGILKTGSVGIGGSTGDVLARSLAGLRELIEREVTGVRLAAGLEHREDIAVAPFIEQIESAATLRAAARQVRFAVDSVVHHASVRADRLILDSVVTNLLHNAFKFTRRGGGVRLVVRATDHHVIIDVEDECGGLPSGKAEDLFAAFAQRGADRTGLGLGLGICARGAEIHGGSIRVVDRPGTGCTFTLELPRQLAAAS